MSRYVITQEQLDNLQQQLRRISNLTDIKIQRIKELEAHQIRVSEPEAATLVKTIGQLEDEVSELKKTNELLVSKIELLNKSKEEQIRGLQTLLNEERKLREYSETFAKQLELKCAEEILLRELTSELCQLQKNEIEIDNKKISELQNELKKMSEEVYESQAKHENKRKYSTQSDTSKQLKAITQKLHFELMNLYNDSDKIWKSQNGGERNEKVKGKLQKWMKEMKVIMEKVDDIEKMKSTLHDMKEEIENRRKANSHIKQ